MLDSGARPKLGTVSDEEFGVGPDGLGGVDADAILARVDACVGVRTPLAARRVHHAALLVVGASRINPSRARNLGDVLGFVHLAATCRRGDEVADVFRELVAFLEGAARPQATACPGDARRLDSKAGFALQV